MDSNKLKRSYFEERCGRCKGSGETWQEGRGHYDLKPCPECEGRGGFLTEEGKWLVDLVRRHLAEGG